MVVLGLSGLRAPTALHERGGSVPSLALRKEVSPGMIINPCSPEKVSTRHTEYFPMGYMIKTLKYTSVVAVRTITQIPCYYQLQNHLFSTVMGENVRQWLELQWWKISSSLMPILVY